MLARFLARLGLGRSEAPPAPAAPQAPQCMEGEGFAALVATLRAVEMAEPERWAAALARPCRDYSITPGVRLAAFAATIAHESNGGRALVEGMRYSARRLTEVWPRRFPTIEAAQPYAWDASDPDPEDVALANATYGARMGNEANGTADDDGWRYRGRGLIHITGRANYERAGAALGMPLADLPDLAAEPEAAAAIAAWWWAQHGGNELADTGEVEAWRKRVNGGLVGLADVRGRYEAARLAQLDAA